jgi:hypothetical protein
MSDRPAEFVVRRARWLTAVNLFFALGLLVLALVNIYWQWSRGESLVTGAMFTFIFAYYSLITVQQLRDRQPQLAIGTAGLDLPAASADPIPWSRITYLRIKQRLIPMLGGRLDIQVDPETFLRLKLGQRLMGDFILKQRGIPNTFMVLTKGLDRRTADIEAAVKRYWPPDGV